VVVAIIVIFCDPDEWPGTQKLHTSALGAKVTHLSKSL
jgi:hypothetical protein